MSKTDVFIIPVAPVRERPAPASAGKPAPGGIRLGLLDNSKGNADHLLALLADSVRTMFPVSSVLTLRKSSAATRADDKVLEELAANADFVVSAMAD
jgi:hypothetical protein